MLCKLQPEIIETIKEVKEFKLYQLQKKLQTIEMKAAFMLPVLLLNLIGFSSGIECYSCTDHGCYRNPSVIECLGSEAKFCATAFLKNPKDNSGISCKDLEYCIEKDCDNYYCNKTGSIVRNHANYTVFYDCCTEDLCNHSNIPSIIPSSVQKLYINIFVYFFVFSFSIFSSI